jgi:hypothetical protein
MTVMLHYRQWSAKYGTWLPLCGAPMSYLHKEEHLTAMRPLVTCKRCLRVIAARDRYAAKVDRL